MKLFLAVTAYFSIFSNIAMQAMHKWNYDIISVTAASSNEDLLKPRLHAERVKRIHTISGTIDWKYDATDTYFELLTFRSATGSSEFKLMPYHVNKAKFTVYVNTIYKKYLQQNFQNCSNFPMITGEYTPPWEHKTYYFDKCLPKLDNFPTHIMPGYYKCLMVFTGELDWNITMLVQVS